MWQGKLEFPVPPTELREGWATPGEFERAAHFEAREFACRGCGKVLLSNMMLSRLDKLRELVGEPLRVSSGYRCKEHNGAIGGVAHSAHTLGMAVDLQVYGDTAHHVVRYAPRLFSGVGAAQIGAYPGRFIHLDRADDWPEWDPAKQPRPWFWTYPGRKLLG